MPLPPPPFSGTYMLSIQSIQSLLEDFDSLQWSAGRMQKRFKGVSAKKIEKGGGEVSKKQALFTVAK